jgi:hypothetical protein
VIRIIFGCRITYQNEKMDPDPYQSQKQDPDPHQSKNPGASEVQIGAMEDSGRSQ